MSNLTGGWTGYEVTNSIFANTIQLYSWLLLFVLPLLLGLASNANFILAASYISVIFLLFTAIKVILSIIHKVFDANEPVWI